MTVAKGEARHWLNLFSEETWLEAARHGMTVTGFSPKRWDMVRRIQPGDLMVCYLTGRSVYVGLLRVVGPAYQDETPIWASAVFPSRLPIVAEVLLRPDSGVSVHDLADRLSFFQTMPRPHSNAWTGHFRGSPNRIQPADGGVIEEALRSAAADPSRTLDLASLPELSGAVGRRRSGTASTRLATTPTEDKSAADPPPAHPDSESPPDEAAPIERVESVPSLHAVESDEVVLVRRLEEAGSSSEDAAALERSIVDAFAYLGFRTQRRSGPGDTDVLAVAPLGEDAYKVVIEGKSSRQGRVANAQIGWYALERHKERHGADHILVVAPGFSGGELTSDAERIGAALLTTADLGQVLRLHAETPFDLPTLRDLFRYPGKPDVPLTRMKLYANETARLQRLLPDIIDTITQAYEYGLYDPVNADSLLLPLASRRGGRSYSREEVNAALELLCVPQLSILRRVGEGRYTLQMPKATLVQRLRALVAVFAAPSASTASSMLSVISD